MGGTNNVAGHYDALQTELKHVDAQMNRSVGMAQMELAAKKTRILNEIIQLCASSGLPELARQWEIARSAHFRRFSISVAEGAVADTAANPDFAVVASGAGNETGAVSLASSHNKRKNECTAKARLANVAPETPDQVNDKKVAEKCCQLDRVYVQLETMTTPRGEKINKFPRKHSFVVTVSECYSNSGGGNRTKVEAAEEKRRNGTLVVMRSADNSMLEDGTLTSAVLALAEKLKAWKDERTGGDFDILQRQDRYEVKGLPFDVAVALDWNTYFRHLFTEELSSVGEKRRKKSSGDRRSSNNTKNDEIIAVPPPHALPFFPAGTAVEVSSQVPHPYVPSTVPRLYQGTLAHGTPLMRNYQVVLEREQQEATTQGPVQTNEQTMFLGAQRLASIGGPSLTGQWRG